MMYIIHRGVFAWDRRRVAHTNTSRLPGSNSASDRRDRLTSAIMFGVARDTLILRPDDTPFKTASLQGADVSGSWVSYGKAYKTAADRLVDIVCSKSTTRRDASEICPILFLYRHFLELELKSLVVLGYLARQTVDIKGKVAKVLNTHSLTVLLTEYRTVAAITPSQPIRQRQFDILERCIQEFAVHDSSSYVFRYPIDKKLNSNAVDLNSLDLANLYSVMCRIGQVFLTSRRRLQLEIADLENVESWTDEDTIMSAKDILGIAEWEGVMEEAQDEWDFWDVEPTD